MIAKRRRDSPEPILFCVFLTVAVLCGIMRRQAREAIVPVEGTRRRAESRMQDARRGTDDVRKRLDAYVREFKQIEEENQRLKAALAAVEEVGPPRDEVIAELRMKYYRAWDARRAAEQRAGPGRNRPLNGPEFAFIARYDKLQKTIADKRVLSGLFDEAGFSDRAESEREELREMEAELVSLVEGYFREAKAEPVPARR